VSIAALRRVTLYGLVHEKRLVLDALHAAGCAHLVPLREPDPLEEPGSGQARRAYAALRYLLEAPERRRQRRRDPGFDVDGFAEVVHANRQRHRELLDRRELLAERIATLEPWGEFELPPLEAVAGMRLWFYVLPTKHRRALKGVRLPWQLVHRDPARLFVVVIDRNEPPADLLPVARSRTGSRSLSALREELEEVELALEAATDERIALTRNLELLGANLARAEDHASLRQALSMTADTDRLFAAQAWIPVGQVAAVRAIGEHHRLATVVERPHPDDRPPTLLEARGLLAAGPDLVHFFQTPAYRSWDPGPVVFLSLAVFFAMILADAGYALVLGAAGALGWRRLGRSPMGRRLRPLGAIVLAVTFVYGVLAGSYFGLAPPPGAPLAALAVIDVRDFDVMMRVAVTIGVLHLALGNAMVAWLDRGTRLAWAGVGWIAALAGGLTLWLAGAESAVGRGLLGGGLALVLYGATARGPWGLLELARVTRLFGDVLSYLRLFALGLATASLAATFNGLAAHIDAVVPGIGTLFAVLVLLFGHAINLALGIMSGVVHGLRLNFIEFFGWSLTDEGYPFKAFARKEFRL
jgi:V/A-type H+/Na+-transporting ATPase subunit I